MSEKWAVACDDCHHVTTHRSLPTAQLDATKHGERCAHAVRVYLTRTEQVGSYDPGAKEFTLLGAQP